MLVAIFFRRTWGFKYSDSISSAQGARLRLPTKQTRRILIMLLSQGQREILSPGVLRMRWVFSFVFVFVGVFLE